MFFYVSYSSETQQNDKNPKETNLNSEVFQRKNDQTIIEDKIKQINFFFQKTYDGNPKKQKIFQDEDNRAKKELCRRICERFNIIENNEVKLKLLKKTSSLIKIPELEILDYIIINSDYKTYNVSSNGYKCKSYLEEQYKIWMYGFFVKKDNQKISLLSAFSLIPFLLYCVIYIIILLTQRLLEENIELEINEFEKQHGYLAIGLIAFNILILITEAIVNEFCNRDEIYIKSLYDSYEVYKVPNNNKFQIFSFCLTNALIFYIFINCLLFLLYKFKMETRTFCYVLLFGIFALSMINDLIYNYNYILIWIIALAFGAFMFVKSLP